MSNGAGRHSATDQMFYRRSLNPTVGADLWMAGSSPAMTVKGLTEKRSSCPVMTVKGFI